MRYDTVIFDMDGTLLDTLEDLYNAVNHVLGQFGYPLRTLDEIRRFLGCGARNLIILSLPEGCSEETVDEVLAVYRDYYAAHSNDCTAPYAGIVELLEEMAQNGVQMAVASNKPHQQVVDLNRMYFGRWIPHAVGDRAGQRCKPEPDMVYAVMQTMGAQPERTLYVGDSEVDVHTAINAGLDCAAVTWGFRTQEELSAEGATCFAHTAQELHDIIFG